MEGMGVGANGGQEEREFDTRHIVCVCVCEYMRRAYVSGREGRFVCRLIRHHHC